ncbi:MAG: insulinase family protein [Acidobacteriota bacterium]|nr:insulinase family protein [Acidobacteriota bacterium]
MRPLCGAMMCLVLAASSTGANEPTMSTIFPYPTHVERLENGLEVIVIPMRSEGLVAYWSIVRTGARDEYEPGRTGFAHFFEHMMFRGTEAFPADVYNEIVTEIGADANAYTSDDLTAYHLAFAAEDLSRVMELESDRFQRLAYSEDDFETEAGAVYGEYRKNRTSPFFTIYEAIHKAAFDVHTYGHTAMGYEQDIKKMPQMFDYSRTFFERYYRPDNIVLLITGDVIPDEIMASVREHYGDWQPGYVAPPVSPEPPQTAERRIEVAYEGRSLPIVWLAYKADRYDPSDKTRVAADLLAELAFGPTSEIYRKLVLDEQVVEFISADLPINRDPGLFDIFSRIKDEAKVDAVLSQIDGVIAGFQAAPPDAGRLERLKSRLKYGFLMRLDTPDIVASSLARTAAVTGGIDAVDTYFATVEALTPEDVQQAARTYLARNRRTIAVLRGTE